MFNFELTYHQKALERKPTMDNKVYVYENDELISETNEFQFYGIQNYSQYLNKEVSIKEFYEIALRGHTWRMGHYDLENQNMKKESVDYIQILSLDFDGVESSPQQMSELALSYGLLPNFWYYSFSQGVKSGNNYRLVWVLDQPLNHKEFEAAIVLFMDKFKGERPDISTKDASRLFFGTRHSGELLSMEPLKLASIGFLNVIEKVKGGQEFRKAKTTKKDHGNLVDTLPQPDAVEVGVGWQEELLNACPSWQQWVNGEYIEYARRFVLWSNFKYIKLKDTSSSLVDEIMEYFNEEAYIGHSFSRNEIAEVFRKATYAVPVCKGNQTIPQFFSREMKTVNVEKLDLEVVERIFNDELPIIMERPGMDYIQVQTAMGKTEQYINWLSKKDLTQTKIIIAAPTYSLLHELKDRILRKSPHLEEYIYLPPRSEEFTPEEMFNVQHGVSSGRKNPEERSTILYNLMGYDSKERVSFKKCGVFLVSHAVLSNMVAALHTDYIIIDENIEETVIYNQALGADNLLAIKSGMKEENWPAVDELINDFLKKSVGEELTKAPLGIIFKKRIIKGGKVIEKGNFSFSEFKAAQLGKKGCPGLYYMTKYRMIKVANGEFVIHGRKPILDNALGEGTKIKLFSATPQYMLMKSEYPMVRLNTFGLAKNKGKIIQYTGITGAKGLTGLEHVDKYMAFVENKIGKDIMVITHKAACKAWEDAGFIIEKNDDGEYIHLGNNAGLDKFYGRDIAIVGKLELSEDEYAKQWAIYRGVEPLPQKVMELK